MVFGNTELALKVQIAFQGGGARLVLFYGVIKALQKLEMDGLIEVTRVSGASAGGIAAALFAGRANIDTLVIYHKTLVNSGEILEAFPDLSDPNILQKLVNFGKVAVAGQSLGDETKFAKILQDSLKVSGVKARRINELEIPCFINCTDIVEHKVVTAEPEQSLVQALVDSAAIPFLFRNSGQKIDGGILDNLPVELLVSGEEIIPPHGKAVGISFLPDQHSAPVTKPADLAKRLLETVINERVERSKMLLGTDYFLELDTKYGPTELSTFSVQDYFDTIENTTILELVEARTIEWFKMYLERETKETTLPKENLIEKNQDSISQELRAFAEQVRQRTDEEVVSTSLEVTARSLKSLGAEADEIRFIDVFRAKKRPVQAYVARISMDDGRLPTHLKVHVLDHEGVRLVTNQFLIPDQLGRICWILVLFPEPILPTKDGGLFRVHLTQLIEDYMKPLRIDGADFLSTTITRAESAETAEICLFVPTDSEIRLLKGDWNTIESLGIDCPPDVDKEYKIVGAEETASHAQNERCPAGYKPLVWKTKDLKSDQKLRLICTVAEQRVEK